MLASLIILAMVVWLCSAKHMGFLLVLVAPFMVFLANTPQKSLRKLEWYKTALWLGALIFCTAVQVYYHIDMRQQANQMVVAINQFQQQHQRYPHDRAELGDIDGLENRRIYYFQHKNQPIVSYPATFIVYDTYRYDFEQHQWRYQPE